MKPDIRPVEISFFSPNNVTVGTTKVKNRADKNWAHKHFKNQTNFSDFFICEEYLTRRSTFINENFDLYSTFVF